MSDKDKKNKNNKAIGGRQDVPDHKPCKVTRQRINPQEIAEDLEGYELVKDVKTLRRYDRVKYIDKRNGLLRGGGLVVLGDQDKNYLVIQSFQRNYKTCKPMRYSINLNNVILFRLKKTT